MGMLKRALKILVGLMLCISFLLKLWTLQLEYLTKHNLWLNLTEIKRVESIKKPRGFAVIGDPKISFIVFPKILERLATDPKVDFVVVVGDITKSSRLEEYWLITQQLLNFPKPFLVVPGNHDVRRSGFGWFRRIFGPDNFIVDLKEFSLVLANFSNSKRVFPPEFTILDNLLSQAQKKAIVFLHIPPYDPRKGKLTLGHSLRNPADSNRLLSVLNSHRVSILFCSHIHDFLQGAWGRVKFYITGRAGCDGKGPPHYLRATLSNGRIKVERVEVKISKELTFLDCIAAKVFQVAIWWRRNWIWIVALTIALAIRL